MFCRHCGNEIDEKSVFCSACGKRNIATENESTTKKRRIIIVIAISLFIIGSCLGLLLLFRHNRDSKREASDSKTENVTDTSVISNSSNKDDVDNISITFDFDTLTCDGYVEIEEDHIHSISPRSYIPDTGLYTYNNDITGTGNYSNTTLRVNVDLFQGILFEEKTITDIVCTGQFYMTGTTNEDVLIKQYTEDILGTESLQIEMIPLNSSYTLENGSIITSSPNNFTVSVGAGIFENCVCMIIEDSTEEYGKSYTVSYYAPLVGKVLELHYNEIFYKEYDVEWFVYSELVGVNSTITENQETTYSVWQNGRSCVFWDENNCEHIITIESADNDSTLIISIDDGEGIVLSLYALVENRYYVYSSSDEKYYIEYDTDNLSSLYFRYEKYEGECYFISDIGDDAEYGY